MAAPMASGRWNRAAHPCGFTRISTDGSGGKCFESRRLRLTEIWQLRRVPQRRRPYTIAEFYARSCNLSLLSDKVVPRGSVLFERVKEKNAPAFFGQNALLFITL